MGSCMSTQKEDVQIAKPAAAPADQPLTNFKILLLGAGESGKSTVLKQVRLIHKGKMTAKDIRQCTDAIRKNSVECMQAVLQAMTVHSIPLANEANAEARTRILTIQEDTPFSQQVADDITQLWSDTGVKACYEKRDLYWLLDAAAYYFDEVQRIADPGFEPTEDDVIMTRVRTTGIDSTDFVEPPFSYSVVDVGGQRNERRKWVHCFENVKAVVYLVGLSGYNQCLFEDASVNRMQESLKLFKQVVGNPIFKDTPIFLFLNKKDLFEQMIRKTSLRACFPEYSGPDGDVHAALQFVEGAFKAVMNEACPGKRVHTQVVAARVRMDMKIAWSEVKDTLKSVNAEQLKQQALATQRGSKSQGSGAARPPSKGAPPLQAHGVLTQ